MTFRFIEPPFQFNAPGVAKYPPEVTGNHLLNCMAQRLGWKNLSGRRLLDFGCGVRFARTIANLDIPLALYAGIDTNAEAIDWLCKHLDGPRFAFVHLNAQNPLYNPLGAPLSEIRELPFADRRFDAACMFSVITHQSPSEARAIFEFLRKLAVDRLYFTAFLDPTVETYTEASDTPRLNSTYNPAFLRSLLSETGWSVDRLHEPGFFQQWAFVCTPSRTEVIR